MPMTHQPRRQHVPGSFARVLRGSSRVPLLLAALSAAISPLAITTASGCGGSEDGGATDPAATDGPRVHGLTEQQAAAVVAKVGERNITAGELAEELAEKGSFIRTRYASPERRREFLDQMIRFELLAQEAHRRGYDELPEVTRAQKQMMIRRFLEARFDQGGPDSIPADEVAAYYEAHRREFNTPEQVRASHIRFRDRATAQRVLRELLASPADLQLFRRMNDQHNTDEDAKGRMGDLRFFSRPEERTEHEPDVPAPVATAAFAIEQLGGYYPEVVETEDGFHIVKLTGRRAAMSRPLADAERPIRSRLFRERRETGIEALVTQLREEADVEENLDVLSEIH
ncbi:MAG: peptidyl-prolyl cis-trans isomerase, partial [Sandaracinaceae bacterium]